MPKAVKDAPLLPAPLYQGSVNTWECDDGGHLNVRFQTERFTIGLMHFAHALAMPRAFAPDATSTLAPLDLHMRFHKEALPGAVLSMRGAVIEIGDSDMTLCADMRHAGGAFGATFTLRCTHIEPLTRQRFAWSTRTRAAAGALKGPLPEHAKPRSIDLTRKPCDANLARAIELGAMRIGATAVLPEHCDAFGRLRIDQLFGRASDSAPSLLSDWRREVAAAGGAVPAGAVVEARIAIRKSPRIGDLIEFRSGIVESVGKTLRIVHWVCDPVSGEAYATLEIVALTFDTATRKAIAPSEAAQAAVQKRIVALTI